jgi:HlyD family secretion protein
MTTRPFWSVRGPTVLGILALAFLLLGFGLWSTLTTLSGAVVASGRIEVEQNRQVVQHPDGGVVAEILVTEGAVVKAGAILLRLDGTLIQSERAIILGQKRELTARTARLEAERDGADTISFPPAILAEAENDPELASQIKGQVGLFNARVESASKVRDQLSRRIEQIRAQISGIEAQSVALETQLSLIKDELTSQQGLLDKGLAQASTVLALQREEARLMGLVGELIATRAQSEARITETEIEISRVTTMRIEEAVQELRQIAPVLVEASERLNGLDEQISRLDIRAPVSGIVIGLTVTTPRAVIRPADPVLYLVPQDRPLVIAAQVPPIHIDQIHVGQPVELVFSAFSSRTTPQLKGKISKVSADSFTDQATQAAYYRAEIMLDDGEIARLEGQALLPGMPVEAFIQTQAQTPLAYLIKPFTDYFSRAFRES